MFSLLLKDLISGFYLCLSCICLLAMHTLMCVTFSLPPCVRVLLRLLLGALPGLFLFTSSHDVAHMTLDRFSYDVVQL